MLTGEIKRLRRENLALRKCLVFRRVGFAGVFDHTRKNVDWNSKMILRLTQKLNTKIKAGKLTEMPLNENPYADWSSHLFTADRTQYIILMNTASLYSCVMYGRGITDDGVFINRAMEAIREFTADDGQQFIYRKFIAPSSTTVSFAKALNRSATGSMNDHIRAAKFMLEDDMAPSEIGYRLNATPMSALAGPDGRNYGYPKEVFKRLIGSAGPQ